MIVKFEIAKKCSIHMDQTVCKDEAALFAAVALETNSYYCPHTECDNFTELEDAPVSTNIKGKCFCTAPVVADIEICDERIDFYTKQDALFFAPSRNIDEAMILATIAAGEDTTPTLCIEHKQAWCTIQAPVGIPKSVLMEFALGQKATTNKAFLTN